MTDATYTGRSQDIRVRDFGGGEGSGEGDWFWSGDCGFVIVPGLFHGKFLIWATAAPTVSGVGTGTISTVIPGHLYILAVTGTGTIELDAGDANSFVVHQTPVTITDCT